MAGALTTGEIYNLTGIFYSKHWGTFAPFHTLTIHKEAIRTITSQDVDVYVGYDSDSVVTNETFTPVSGIYSGIVVTDNVSSNLNNVIHAAADKNTVRVKVERPARDYINNGKTLMCDLDGDMYNHITEEKTQNFLGLKFYIFKLEKTE